MRRRINKHKLVVMTRTGIEYSTNIMYLVSQKKFTRLAGYGIISLLPIFKTDMLIYQSKANLHVKIFIRNISHLIDPEIRKILLKGVLGNKNSTFHSVP